MKITFTNHAEKQLLRRQILIEEAINAINNPDFTIKKWGKYYAQKTLQRGRIEIVYEKETNIKVITIYWV